MNRESYFPLSHNPKDYVSTSYEGEDEEFLANDNFRGTNVNNAFSLSECFKSTHDDDELNPPREDFKNKDEDGEEFCLSQDFKSAYVGSEEFPSSEDGNEYFPSNDGDEFSNYVHQYNIPPNDDESASAENNEMREMLQEILYLGVGVGLFISIQNIPVIQGIEHNISQVEALSVI